MLSTNIKPAWQVDGPDTPVQPNDPMEKPIDSLEYKAYFDPGGRIFLKLYEICNKAGCPLDSLTKFSK